jgi:hypothetical protein
MTDKKMITRRKALAGIVLSPVLATWPFGGTCHSKAPQLSMHYDEAFFSKILKVLDEQGALYDCPMFTPGQRKFLAERFEILAPSTHVEAAIFAAFAERAHNPDLKNWQTKIIEEYVRRKEGGKPLMPDHSILSFEDLGMPKTYRILVFREQVTKLMETLTCLPSDKSDRLRKDLLARRINVTSAQFRGLVSPEHKDLKERDYAVIDWNLDVFISCFGLSYVWASTMVSRAEAF